MEISSHFFYWFLPTSWWGCWCFLQGQNLDFGWFPADKFTTREQVEVLEKNDWSLSDRSKPYKWIKGAVLQSLSICFRRHYTRKTPERHKWFLLLVCTRSCFLGDVQLAYVIAQCTWTVFKNRTLWNRKVKPWIGMINKQVFISILFMKNNWEYPKSLVILTTVTHGSSHRSENKKQITKPFWKYHVILRPSNQNYSKVKCFAAPNQSVRLPEMEILLHFTSSPHANMEG